MDGPGQASASSPSSAGGTGAAPALCGGLKGAGLPLRSFFRKNVF